MFRVLAGAGFILTAFFFIPLEMFDLREMRMQTAITCSIILALLVLYTSGFKRVRNKYVLFLMLSLLLSTLLSPEANLDIEHCNLYKFWSWQPLLTMGVFFLLYCAVSSHPMNYKDVRCLLNVMVWCGFLMAIYVMIQMAGCDQFFKATAGDNGAMAGFLGHPTHVAPFIGMLLPLALYLKRYLKAFLMMIAVLIARSSVADIAVLCSLVVYFGLKNKHIFLYTFFFALMYFSIFTVVNLNRQKTDAYFDSKPAIQWVKDIFIFEDHNRFNQWKQIAKDIVNPISEKAEQKFPLTGRGVGSFRFIYHAQHENNYKQAHNDPLEFTYQTGFIGLAFFILSIWYSIKRWWGKNEYKDAIIASLSCIFIASCASFVLQIGTISFYTVFLAGLLDNDIKQPIHINGG